MKALIEQLMIEDYMNTAGIISILTATASIGLGIIACILLAMGV